MRIDMLSKRGRRRTSKKPLSDETGLSMLEMVVALMLVTVGLLGLAGAAGYALTVSNRGRNVTNTKLLVVSILEQMETLRNTKDLTFGQIANQGQVDNTGAAQPFAGFSSNFQAVSMNPGPDGIYGTDDDLLDAGPDGVYGTADDFTNPALARAGYTRQVQISFLGGNPNLKRIQVTLRYPSSSGQIEQLTGVSYLNNDARSNFLP